MKLKPQELEQIRARERAATPGPWVDTSTPDEVRPIWSTDDEHYGAICVDPDMDDRESDRKFIAAARTDIPRLLEHIAELTKGLNAVRSLIENSEGVYGLHLNDDPAPWSELLSVGRFEEWLVDFDNAIPAPTPGEGETQ